MGAVYASQVEKPGRYVLSLLRENRSIRYSEHFYDGSDELEEEAARKMGLEPDDAEFVACLVDYAVDQLVGQGFVTTTELDELMADGEKDYLIELTDKGRTLLSDGRERQVTFRDMYL